MTASSGSERRFTGVRRLFGDQAYAAFGAGHVCVIGLGGVGSWAAEALARSGVGALTLIDLDHVAESNVNRQVQALTDTLGAAKVLAMRARIEAIAPECRVDVVEEFLTADNAAAIAATGFSAVIDAIDQVHAKVALAAACRAAAVPLVMCGAAGGKTDPTRIRHADLSETAHDALLAKVRARLRRDHGFARSGRMRVETVYSDQPMLRHPWGSGQELPAGGGTGTGARSDSGNGGGAFDAGTVAPIFDAGAGLACAGYGSAVTLTAPMGFAAAARVLDALARRARVAPRQHAGASTG